MLSFDVLDKFSPNGESIVVLGTFLNWAAMWAMVLVHDCEVRLEIFNRIERFLDRASMDIASAGLYIIHEVGMSSFNVDVKFVFSRKSDRTAGAARIRTVEIVFLRMGSQVTLQVTLSRKAFPVLTSRDIAPVELHMILEMSVKIDLVLEYGSKSPRSAARPLTFTLNDEVASRLITMAMQMLSKLLFSEECLSFAGWPFTTHWCYGGLREKS